MSKLRQPTFTLTTGPVNCYPEVLQGLARPVLYDYDPVFQETYERVSRKLCKVMATDEPPLILQGEPVLGLEAAAASAVSGEDTVLNLVSGVYGEGYGFWLQRYCKELMEIRVPFNEAIDPASVEKALAERPDIKVVAVCHHDTPSGTINPVREIGEIVAKSGAIFIVDAVSSFGGMDVLPNDIKADIFVTGPNKCLGCPPGLSLLSVSDAAWKKIETNPTAPSASILSLSDWKTAHKATDPFPFTPSVAEINGLEAAVDRYLEEGAQTVWARHALTARACRAGVTAMGLSLWAASEDIASPTATSVTLPQGVSDAALRGKMRETFGVMISSGRGETHDKLVRIGHMGPTAEPLYAIVALTALGGAVSELTGKAYDVGAGVTAAMEVIAAAS
ncbi:pyridoxamine--pyruvate transaminase [Roseibium aggregatum]|uniref:Alanine--glyoxylate aminotransferase family protein n=1 Tax=Roseibium aggregatum TaxID=187304 RepID=A0A939J728_9HYPH|nr:alanine--glyoxylate aminotransferase family protein [Roseibium aggregatum]MBN9673905.1 alanine--glyoxylate aminotransferase family protein [Roseibium aggregatum]